SLLPASWMGLPSVPLLYNLFYRFSLVKAAVCAWVVCDPCFQSTPRTNDRKLVSHICQPVQATQNDIAPAVWAFLQLNHSNPSSISISPVLRIGARVFHINEAFLAAASF